MDFKKKFDYNDINTFTFDNNIGTAEYYNKKFNNKLPLTNIELLLEALTLDKYSNDDVNEIKTYVMIEQQKYNEKLLTEYNERLNNNISSNIINDLRNQ